jgi:glycosyltransferase involved in cell wall biosynthesis
MDAARRAAAVVVAVPTWNDVLPTVILEAMANGRPVLGTAVGGIPYLLGVDQATPPAGWAIKPDPDSLAAALPIARAEAAAFAPAARDRYVRAFHPDVLIRQLIDIYGVLTVNSHPTPR